MSNPRVRALFSTAEASDPPAASPISAGLSKCTNKRKSISVKGAVLRKIRVVVICLLMALSGLLVIAPKVAADWCTQSFMSYSPTSGYAGHSVSFSFTFENGADATIQLSEFSASYSWGGFSDLGLWVVGPYESVTGTSSVSLPASASQESITVTVSGRASTDPYSISCIFGPMPFTVASAPPLFVSFSASTSLGDAPLDVTFLSSITGGTPPYSYSWSFGDGNGSNAPNPTHVYTGAGNFLANLDVTDSLGTRNSASKTIIVNSALVVSISVRPSEGASPLSVTFLTTPFGGKPPYTFRWSFGDGNVSSVQSPNHTYERPGTYNATVTLTDSVGGTSSTTREVVVRAASSGFPSLGGLLPFPGWLVIVIAVAAAAAGILAFVRVRRSRKTPPASPPSPPV